MMALLYVQTSTAELRWQSLGPSDASPESGRPDALLKESAKQETECSGDGRVDFDAMAAKVDNVLYLKKWLLSGLCPACQTVQTHIFHDSYVSGG